MSGSIPRGALRFSQSLATQRHATRPHFFGSSESHHWTRLTEFCIYKSTGNRSFHSAPSVALPRPSQALRYPRWINSKDAKPPGETAEDAAAEEPAEDAAESSEKDSKRVSGKEAGESDSTPPSSSVPPSSESHDEPPDNKPPGNDPPPENSGSSSSSSSAISKQSVPEVYPQVLALPITRRPLFPGFYKAVVVRDPAVVAAIKEMMKRGQPYIGAFLLKDENADSDIITDIDSVHRVGVFAQITSVFPASATKDDSKDESLTAVLYPHRRIRISELFPPGKGPSTASFAEVKETNLEPDKDVVSAPVPEVQESATEPHPCA